MINSSIKPQIVFNIIIVLFVEHQAHTFIFDKKVILKNVSSAFYDLTKTNSGKTNYPIRIV